MEEKYVKVKGYSIRYLEDGKSNSEHLLLIHGLGASADRWVKVIPILAKHFHVVAPDLIGFGYSDKPDAHYTLPFFVDFVKRFTRTMRMKRFNLIGYSFGGHIAAEVAIAHKRLLEKLALVCPAGIMKQPTPALEHYITAALYPTFQNAIMAFQEMAGKKKIDERYTKDFIKRMNMKNAKHAFISTIMGSQASNLKERLHKIKAHTLILWGKKDPVIPVEFAREFHAEIKNSQVVIMKNAKHTPFYERPEEFSSIIIDFLEK